MTSLTGACALGLYLAFEEPPAGTAIDRVHGNGCGGRPRLQGKEALASAHERWAAAHAQAAEIRPRRPPVAQRAPSQASAPGPPVSCSLHLAERLAIIQALTPPPHRQEQPSGSSCPGARSDAKMTSPRPAVSSGRAAPAARARRDRKSTRLNSSH